jgi:uncharacterized protein (DUF2147 family)
LAAAVFAASTLSTAFAHDPKGLWQVSTGESRYQVFACQRDRLCAKLVWLRNDAQTADVLPYLNTYIVTGAVEVLPDQWSGALRYRGESYEGHLSVLDDAHMALKGCKGLLCQTFRLIRVNLAGR